MGQPRKGSQEGEDLEVAVASTPTHSEATNACSLMVCRTSENLILVVRVCPW